MRTKTIALASARRALIVDDNTTLAENIAEILEIDGWVTDVSGSAEEALLAEEPSVVISDYRLPGMNGVDFVKRFLCEYPRVVAVMMSAYGDSSTIEAAMAAGATFLPKPINFAMLVQMIGSHSWAHPAQP